VSSTQNAMAAAARATKMPIGIENT
jgi:hypothetical protein